MISIFDRFAYSAFVLGTNAVCLFAGAYVAHLGWALAS